MAADTASVSECGCPGCQKGALCWEAGREPLKVQYQCCDHCDWGCIGRTLGHLSPCTAQMCLEGRRTTS